MGLRYYRFWVVKTLIQSAPIVMFRGGPLYSLYLRLLGAKLGPVIMQASGRVG